MSNPKILVLGAGGIGGYFGGRLVESGADVTFLVREGRRKILSERGLQIESPFGHAKLAVETVVASDVAPIFDAVISACKRTISILPLRRSHSPGTDRLRIAVLER